MNSKQSMPTTHVTYLYTHKLLQAVLLFRLKCNEKAKMFVFQKLDWQNSMHSVELAMLPPDDLDLWPFDPKS